MDSCLRCRGTSCRGASASSVGTREFGCGCADSTTPVDALLLSSNFFFSLARRLHHQRAAPPHHAGPLMGRGSTIGVHACGGRLHACRLLTERFSHRHCACTYISSIVGLLPTTDGILMEISSFILISNVDSSPIDHLQLALPSEDFILRDADDPQYSSGGPRPASVTAVQGLKMVSEEGSCPIYMSGGFCGGGS